MWGFTPFYIYYETPILNLFILNVNVNININLNLIINIIIKYANKIYCIK